MIAVAQVLFKDNRSEDDVLASLEKELARSLPFRVGRTEWRGYSIVIQQILVETSPVELTLQIDRNPAVRDELEELVESLRERLSPEALRELAASDTRVDIMSVSPAHVEESAEAITVFASSDLDPSSPEVAVVLERLVELTGGWLIDNAEGRLRPPGTNVWLQMYEE